MAGRTSQKAGGQMAIEKCINEFDVDDVIFEEGSTGRELFVVLEGKIDIVKINGASKTVIVTLGKGEFFGEMAVIDGSSRSATAIAATPHTRAVRINTPRVGRLPWTSGCPPPGGGDPPPRSPSGRQSHERPQAEPVSDTAEQRRLLA